MAKLKGSVTLLAQFGTRIAQHDRAELSGLEEMS
jgi:hypothetical protein